MSTGLSARRLGTAIWIPCESTVMSDLQPEVEVIAVVVGLLDHEPHVFAVETNGGPPALPAGPLLSGHRSLQQALRAWVEQQTGFRLGFVDQLYTFADLDRGGTSEQRSLSICYLALTPPPEQRSGWIRWYDLFGWEDHRGDGGVPTVVTDDLRRWADMDTTGERRLRLAILFGWGDHPWQPELALRRFETLYEAGLVAESGGRAQESGPPMARDHRRIVATGISRLRAAIQYRPVIFEAMPALFTLGQLQQAVESIAGQRVHKQNFRRLVMSQNLVEATGSSMRSTGGRPAELFSFRAAVLDERAAAGTKLPRPH